MIDLIALQALDAIDRTGSFAGAASELGRVPSAMTYLVRKLEGDLDVLLFDRRGHRAKLTPAGRELLTEGRYLLQAANELQRRVQRVGDGWEAELRIVLDTVIRIEPVLDLLKEFYANDPGTRVRLFTEVLSGTWEALISGRAEIAIGTFSSSLGLSQMTGGYQSRPLGGIDMVFAVSPDHPLADAPEPLTPATVRRHRAVAVGDTARSMPNVTIGLLGGQDVLTVPNMDAKVAAQAAGLGCGNLPVNLARPYIDAGLLVPKLLTESRMTGTLHCSWTTSSRGRALRWFVQRLDDPALREALIG